MIKVTKRIPKAIDDFARFINETDDLQKSTDVHGFTIYPLDANGKIDYLAKEGKTEIKNEPMYRRYDWKHEESKMWSKFRAEFEELNNERKEDLPNPELDKKLKKIITDFIAYDGKTDLIEKVDSMQTPTYQLERFHIRQDLLTFETPFRDINIKYEEEIPFNKFEKDFIKKYKALHDASFRIGQRIRKVLPAINNLHNRLPHLWEQIPALKEKLDKAQNSICIPPPTMKGSMVSEVISFTVPTPEESQKRTDDFNEHITKFQGEVTQFCNECTATFKEVEWFETFWDNDEEEYQEPLFEKIDAMVSNFLDMDCRSLDYSSIDDDHQDFLGAWSQLMKEGEKISDPWSKFVDEQKLFMGVYTAFIYFLQDSFAKNDHDEDTEVIDVSKPLVDEQDDLRAETLRRYEADVKNDTNIYFDSMDWHIILDKYDREWDNKNKRIIMKKALAQHPEEPVLLIRYANMELKDQNFQKALELFKQVEKIGPPFHPNYYSVKAHVYLELQSPDQAIPLYRKLTEQQGDEIKWWRLNSYSNLVDIYDAKKDWDECIKISKTLIAEEPDKDLWTTRLAYFLAQKMEFNEAEKVLKSFIETHPKSSQAEKQLGHTYFDQKDYLNAIQHYDRAFNLDKDENYGVLYNKGNALFELKRFDEAAVCFETCILYFKLEKDYNLAAGKCYLALNQNYLAKAHYKRVLFLDRDNKEAIDALVLMQKSDK